MYTTFFLSVYGNMIFKERKKNREREKEQADRFTQRVRFKSVSELVRQNAGTHVLFCNELILVWETNL